VSAQRYPQELRHWEVLTGALHLAHSILPIRTTPKSLLARGAEGLGALGKMVAGEVVISSWDGHSLRKKDIVPTPESVNISKQIPHPSCYPDSPNLA
jgi:hypothetical protein